MRAAGGALVLAMLSASVCTAEERRWATEARASYVVIGGGRPTGGMMPSFVAKRSWALAEHVDLAVGAHFGMFGFGGGTSWLGVLGGPAAWVAWRPSSISFTLGANADVGRVPVCNAWGYCMRYIGLFPAGELATSWAASSRFDMTVTLDVRAVSTWGWSGATVEPGVGGRVWW